MRRAAVLLAALVLTGCGGDDAADAPRLTVGAASSLREALATYARGIEDADVKLSFAGSDALAAQIRAGVRPDVFVSADAAIAERLHDEGLAGKPVSVATNRVVVAVGREGSKVRSFSDLSRRGVTIGLGTATVPIGSYADEALRRLPAGERRRILANVRTREPDVAGVLGKVAEGAVDAGIVYATDVAAADGVLAIAVPADLQPRIEYAAVVVKDGAAAERFVAGLAGAHPLEDAGCGPP